MSSPTSDSSSGAPKQAAAPQAAPKKRRYKKAVGPKLQRVLAVVFGLFALLTINSTYLVGVSVLEAWTAQTFQNWFYMNMFLAHLILGALILVPALVFGFIHMYNTYDRRNRRAVKAGYALFTAVILLLVSGIILTRLEGVIVVKDETTRAIAYWVHVITPILAVWLFVLHRLAGKKIKWQVGRRWAVVAAVFAAVLLIWQAQDPRSWNVEGPESGEQYFFPSLARTATGDFIPEGVLMNDQYCMKCHEDTHRSWAVSAHRFSSFNNPPYKFSVNETRSVAEMRDGTVQASRFCAGCHDPVVFFSGKFDDPNFDMDNDPTGQAGITCTVCHAVTNINSLRGNADYTIEEPIHYPFASSESETLQWVNEQLVKAKPEFHKRTFLKPLHKSPEFCGSCHKVHLPEELNKYKWLRGQNHFDSYHLSGVSGHGVASFYYPPAAEQNCNECHMPALPSQQFGAQDRNGDGEREIHDHQFPSANTAIPQIVGMPSWVNERHAAFNDGVMRLDIFALKEGGSIDAEPIAPLRPEIPELTPGRDYLLDIVVRTAKMGHHFTQGTADSNQVWLDVRLIGDFGDGARVIGRSGGMDASGRVDPWSHFVNAYVLDKDGKRIDRRNAEDIFVALYNHQIPPGAADSVHFKFRLPEAVSGPVWVEARLQYRKFDTTYMAYVEANPDYVNELPILTLASDTVTFPVVGMDPSQLPPSPMPLTADLWQRWNDYGIGLLRKGGKSKGELRQAEAAFEQVEALGRPEGALNLARVYFTQGTVQDKAINALERASRPHPESGVAVAPAWTVAWFTGLVNKQNGFLDEAIANFRSILELDDAETRKRGFDFSQDYRVWSELGQTLYERARQERGESRRAERQAFLDESRRAFETVLSLEPEHVAAHYNLYLLWREAGQDEKAAQFLELYRKYKVDDNARDKAVAVARAADPAANHAAEAIVLYDLQRDGAFEADASPETRRAAPFEIQILDSSGRGAEAEERMLSEPSFPWPKARRGAVADAPSAEGRKVAESRR